MSKMQAKVSDFMTPGPAAVQLAESLQNAQETMSRFGIRHLPVRSDGKVVGILSARDIAVAKGFKHGNLKQLTVEDVYEPEVYVTHPGSSLKDVALEMAERRIGSAVVIDDDDLVGIFTTTDACRALGDVLG
jgi:acetoin utilization protein AcuB